MYTGGWPDQGSGRYTMRAGYRAWMEIFRSQRIHQNWVEVINQMIVCQLIAGIWMPITTAIWTGIYIIARIGYACGYSKSVKARATFAPILVMTQILFPLFTVIVTAIFYFKVPDQAKGKDGEMLKVIHSGLYTGAYADKEDLKLL